MSDIRTEEGWFENGTLDYDVVWLNDDGRRMVLPVGEVPWETR